MERELVIWVLGDGKPGHENQTLGVAEAIQRRNPCRIHKIDLSGARWFLARLRQSQLLGRELPQPDWIFGAGHSTHLPLIWLAARFRAKSVVFMKPSLPISCFGHCIAPYHDYPQGASRANLLLVYGAPNRVTPGIAERGHGLILVGGPAFPDQWDGEILSEAIDRLVADGGDWVIGDSRRTPGNWLQSVGGRWRNAHLVSHEDTPQDWVRDKLQASDPVWVTEDSVSMICEASGSGANVGILPMPGARRGGRVQQGIEGIVAAGYATRFEDWKASGRFSPVEKPLLEADRCAEWLLRSWARW